MHFRLSCGSCLVLSDGCSSELPSLPHLAGDSRILDSISRSPASSSKSPAFYKQSLFPFNSTAKIAPRMHQNAFLSSKIEKFSGRGHSPLLRPHPQWGEGDIGASLSVPSASRSRRQSLSPASLFLNLGSSGSWL